jgi:hypothetical protein
MRRTGRSLLVGGVAAALGVIGTVFAYAGGWALADNTASFTVKVAKMPRGVEPSVAKQSGRAVVTWTAQELTSGSLMDHYVVTAHRVGAPGKPDIARTVAASGTATEVVTFTATELASGTWHWTVVPKFRDWTGTASRTSRNLTFPAAPALRPTAPGAPSTPSSGGPVTPGSSPAPGGTATTPEKKPETTAPGPARSTEPPGPVEPAPQPVESTSSDVEPPPSPPEQ